YGRLVASYLSTPAALVENPDLGDGEVVVVAGAALNTAHDQPAPTEETTTTTAQAGQPAASSSTTAGDGTTTTAAGSSPATATTEPNPFIMGEPPPGETCE